MAIVIDVEQFCIFRAKQAMLSDGHNAKRCPQCQALRRLTVLVNNQTLDMIEEIFNHCAPGTQLDAKETGKQIAALKTVQ